MALKVNVPRAPAPPVDTTWRPDYTKPDPYAGMPPEYEEKVKAAYVPTEDFPLNPIERARKAGQIVGAEAPPKKKEVPIEIPTTATSQEVIAWQSYRNAGGDMGVSDWLAKGRPAPPVDTMGILKGKKDIYATEKLVSYEEAEIWHRAVYHTNRNR